MISFTIDLVSLVGQVAVLAPDAIILKLEGNLVVLSLDAFLEKGVKLYDYACIVGHQSFKHVSQKIKKFLNAKQNNQANDSQRFFYIFLVVHNGGY